MPTESRPVDTLLDSFAWIEYFRGTQLGETVDRSLRSSACATPALVLAELSDKYQREKRAVISERLDFVELRTTILPLTRPVAERAGATKAARRSVLPDFPLADAIIYETAREWSGTLLTGDPHFRGMDGVRFLQ